jgi:predicted nucleotidyltransferase
VVLFGSLATAEHHVGSDLDLAATGIPPTRYFAALADLMGLVHGPVDLVRLEEAPASLAERIEADGIDL